MTEIADGWTICLDHIQLLEGHNVAEGETNRENHEGFTSAKA